MYDELWKLLRESRNTIAFTGAGISTLSGISNFSEERFRLLCIPGKAMPTTTV